MRVRDNAKAKVPRVSCFCPARPLRDREIPENGRDRTSFRDFRPEESRRRGESPSSEQARFVRIRKRLIFGTADCFRTKKPLAPSPETSG